MTKHDDEHELLKDGERIRVPLMFMDSMQRDVREHFQTRMVDGAAHRPGFRYQPRASADALKQANDHWQKPGMIDLLVKDAGVDVARAAIIDSYEAYDAELCQRYRTAPVTDPVPAPETLLDEEFDPTVDAREQAYIEYDRRTSDAWKGGR